MSWAVLLMSSVGEGGRIRGMVKHGLLGGDASGGKLCLHLRNAGGGEAWLSLAESSYRPDHVEVTNLVVNNISFVHKHKVK